MKHLLEQLRIKADIQQEEHTGNIVRYYLKLHPETSLERIRRKATELSLGIKAYGEPLIYPILHRGQVVLEFVTKPPETVYFNEFNPADYPHLRIPLIIGQTHSGEPLVLDLTELPHALVAGSTGSGKSVLLNSIICSILESKRNIKLALIDPKVVELTPYKNIRQLMYPIAQDVSMAQDILDDLIAEMNSRYRYMVRKEVNDVSQLIDAGNKIPYIVLVIDEYSDLALSTNNREFANKLCLLAQKSRSAGIHIVLATQRPQVSIINGAIKANFSARCCFRVASSVDSRVILDQSGGERLAGNGDGLLTAGVHNLTRFKGAYLSRQDIDEICMRNEVSLKTKAWRMIKGWL